MAVPTCLIPGAGLPDPAADFRSAKRIEQYRLSTQALYIPAGLRWNYIPFSAVISAEDSHRTISAGHCVTVEVKRAEIDLTTSAGITSIALDREADMKTILNAISAVKGQIG